ncbi:MAG: hypothetical protein R2856_26860 [Caldilineaceae bacterium]
MATDASARQSGAWTDAVALVAGRAAARRGPCASGHAGRTLPPCPAATSGGSLLRYRFQGQGVVYVTCQKTRSSPSRSCADSSVKAGAVVGR